MVTWEEFTEFLTKLIFFIKNVIWELLDDLSTFIAFEFINVIISIKYFIQLIFRIIIYIAIIYYLLLVFSFSNSQIIELISKILKHLNDNDGAIQAIATTILVIITARYATITQRMLKLEKEKHFFEKTKIWKKESEERNKTLKKENRESIINRKLRKY